jgi:NHL repeat/Secretion system C-terminal sorting domain
MNCIYKTPLSLAVVFAVTTNLPQRVYAQSWTNGEAATYVIGQTGFGLNGETTTATGLYQPFAVAEDPATGKVFVCDLVNNRILRYPSSAAMTDGAAAEAVLGQANFTSNDGNAGTGSVLNEPTGIAIDASGNLWVADFNNKRVLRFANAATIASGAAASGVLGQPNFASSAFTPISASLMYGPFSVFCSGTTLYVADGDNFRVLRYDNAASLANGAPANAVFGASNFTTMGDAYLGTATAANIGYPGQIYVDAADNLWVVNLDFHRVLMFPNASTAANGEAATLVLGQPDFSGNNPGSTASTFTQPYGLYGDGSGNIYVADGSNNRILIFANAASLSNGAAATYVLGQPDFTSTANGDGASQLYFPENLWVSTSGITLMAADPGNNRVMIWTPAVTLPLLLTSFTGRLQSNGQALLQWQISDQGGPSGAMAELQYSTRDTIGFTAVLNTQPINPAISGYSYVQVSPATGPNYYRVKLTAPDGSATYSQVVAITVGNGGTGSTGLSIYPNPAQSSVVVTVPQTDGGMGRAAGTTGPAGTMGATGTAAIGIYSSTGMLMQRLVTGAAVNEIDISRLAAGLYTVQVVQGGSIVTGSFVKVR